MSINFFIKAYKNEIKNFKNNKDVSNFISSQYDSAVKLGSATGIPPAGGPSAKYLSGNKNAMSIVINKSMDIAKKNKINLKLENILPPALFAYWISGGLVLTSTASGILPPSLGIWPSLAIPGVIRFDYSKADNNKNFNNIDNYLVALKKFLVDWTNKTSFTLIPPTGTLITVSYKLG